MKVIMSLLVMAVCLLFGSTSLAEKKKELPIETTNQAKSEKSHNFEDLLVQGKYHFTDEAVSTVEDDKVLDSLLGLRSDFKDRMVQSAEQF